MFRKAADVSKADNRTTVSQIPDGLIDVSSGDRGQKLKKPKGVLPTWIHFNIQNGGVQKARHDDGR